MIIHVENKNYTWTFKKKDKTVSTKDVDDTFVVVFNDTLKMLFTVK